MGGNAQLLIAASSKGFRKIVRNALLGVHQSNLVLKRTKLRKNMTTLLKFGRANDKLKKLEARLGKRLYTISLKAGYSCPGANLCFAKFDRSLGDNGQIVDGQKAEFRCFAASLEAVFKGFEANNAHNFELMKRVQNRRRDV